MSSDHAAALPPSERLEHPLPLAESLDQHVERVQLLQAEVRHGLTFTIEDFDRVVNLTQTLAGMDDDAMSEWLDVSRVTVSRWRRGLSRPRRAMERQVLVKTVKRCDEILKLADAVETIENPDHLRAALTSFFPLVLI